MALAIWLIYLTLLIRAGITGHLKTYFAWNTWLQFGLCLLIFTLRGTEIERSIDQHFGSWPVTMFIKNAVFLVWFGLHADLLWRVGATTYWKGFTRAVFVSGAVLIVGSVALYGALPVDKRDDSRDLVVALREIILLIPAFTTLLPGTIALYRAETIQQMRWRLGLAALCYGVLYPVLAVSNIIVGAVVLTGIDIAEPIKQVLSTYLSIGVVLLVILFLPYRHTRIVYLLWLWIRYLRLRYIERRVYQLSGFDAKQAIVTPWESIWSISKLEMATYAVAINILDYYPLIKDKKVKLGDLAVLERPFSLDDEFSRLIDELLRIRL